MGELFDNYGNKSPGQLIRSADWNGLITDLETTLADLETRLTEQFTSQLEALDTRLTAVEGLADRVTALETFQARVEPLLTQYYRVTLQTTKVNYALGELAEITAQVTDLQGNPLTFANDADRPWIDLVTTWGQFRPAPGFTSRFEIREGVGDRTISIRVNRDGIAQVSLRSDYAEGLTVEDEAEMAAALEIRPPSQPNNGNLRVADLILQAETPQNAQSAYRAISQVYIAGDTQSQPNRVRSYLDTHYLRNSALLAGKLLPFYRTRWRNYRATVMAFAKPDGDPTTPDTSLGVSSLQINFRDWIGPWIIDFTERPDISVVEPIDPVITIRDRLRPKITRDYLESVTLVKEEVNELIRGKGLVGKQREYQLIRTALDGLAIDQPPPFLNTLNQSVGEAITLQQTLENAQVSTPGLPSETVAFQVFTNAAVRADTNVEAAKAEVAQAVEQQFTTELAQFRQDLNQRQTAFEDSITAEGGALRQAFVTKAELAPVSQQITVLNRELGEPSQVRDRLSNLGALETRLRTIETVIQQPR